MTTDAIHELCSRDVGISYFTTGGWYFGTLSRVPSVNVYTRIAQFRLAADASAAVTLARAMVAGKISNCRTLLRRNAREKPALALDQLSRFADEALRTDSIESLLGIEGSAARVYFQSFPSMIATADSSSFDFERRNRRRRAIP